MAKTAKGERRGGRKAGVKNRSTLEIRDLLDKYVNWGNVFRGLVKLAPKNPMASRLLLEYRFGKPREQGGTIASDELGRAMAAFARQMVSDPGKSLESSEGQSVQNESSQVSDGPRGETKLQDGDSQTKDNQ